MSRLHLQTHRTLGNTTNFFWSIVLINSICLHVRCWAFACLAYADESGACSFLCVLYKHSSPLLTRRASPHCTAARSPPKVSAGWLTPYSLLGWELFPSWCWCSCSRTHCCCMCTRFNPQYPQSAVTQRDFCMLFISFMKGRWVTDMIVWIHNNWCPFGCKWQSFPVPAMFTASYEVMHLYSTKRRCYESAADTNIWAASPSPPGETTYTPWLSACFFL